MASPAIPEKLWIDLRKSSRSLLVQVWVIIPPVSMLLLMTVISLPFRLLLILVQWIAIILILTLCLIFWVTFVSISWTPRWRRFPCPLLQRLWIVLSSQLFSQRCRSQAESFWKCNCWLPFQRLWWQSTSIVSLNISGTHTWFYYLTCLVLELFYWSNFHIISNIMEGTC